MRKIFVSEQYIEDCIEVCTTHYRAHNTTGSTTHYRRHNTWLNVQFIVEFTIHCKELNKLYNTCNIVELTKYCRVLNTRLCAHNVADVVCRTIVFQPLYCILGAPEAEEWYWKVHGTLYCAVLYTVQCCNVHSLVLYFILYRNAINTVSYCNVHCIVL